MQIYPKRKSLLGFILVLLASLTVVFIFIVYSELPKISFDLYNFDFTFGMPLQVIDALFFVIFFILIFLLFREFFAWYWKINKMVDLLQQIERNTSNLNTSKVGQNQNDGIQVSAKKIE